MSSIVSELSRVLSRPIDPLQLSSAVFLIVDPVTFVLDTIWPDVQAKAIDLIIAEMTSVHASIGTLQGALTLLFAHVKLTRIGRAVRERLFSLSVWLLITPLTLVKCSVWVLTDAFAVQEIVHPVTLVLGAIGVVIGAMAMSLTHGPVTEVV